MSDFSYIMILLNDMILNSADIVDSLLSKSKW